MTSFYEHLILIPEVIEDIKAIGAARLPNEACGILLPPNKIIELTNHAENATDSYALDPEEAFEAVEPYLDKLPEGVEAVDLVVWHTHPGGGIGPSRGDLAERINGVHYMVVTLPTGEVVQY